MRPIAKALFLFFLFSTVAVFGQDRNQSAEATDPSTYDAALIPIRGDIDPFQVVFLRRSIDKAVAAGVSHIIFSINTFGGRVDSALQIATLIGAQTEINTVAFVPAEPESVGVSWSAGALISFSCSQIFMAPGTSIGAAAPVYQTSEGMEEAEEKTVSAVRTQLAAIAEKNGYPPEVAIAMVDKDVELRVLPQDGAYIFDLLDKSAAEGQPAQTSSDGAQWEVLSPSGKLLSLTAGEMERYGISSGTVSNADALLSALDLQGLYRINPTSADRVIGLLTGAAVTSLLLTIGLLALYLEISSPGFGIPGTVALVAFALMFLTSGLMGTLSSVELLLFMAGVILLVVEVFLIPGFGVAGITGLIFMTTGLILARQEFILPDTEWQWDIFTRNILLVLGTLTASFLLMGILMIFFPRIRLFQRLILSSASGTGGSPAAAGPAGGRIDASASSDRRIAEGRTATPPKPPAGEEAAAELIGKVGSVYTPLRPAGKIFIDDKLYSVVTEGRWVEKEAQVKVVSVEGNRIVVEEVR